VLFREVVLPYWVVVPYCTWDVEGSLVVQTIVAPVVVIDKLDTPLITGAAIAMVRVRLALPVPVLLVALRVTVDVPAAVGVPETKPVPLFKVSPDGNPVAP
jgi:hypothetical protein